MARCPRPLAPLLLLAALTPVLPACGTEPPADPASADAITTDALRSKGELFEEEMLLVRIRGWAGNPADLRSQAEPARLGDAELTIEKTRASVDEPCPTRGNTLVYQSKAWTLRTSGNLTNGTPKSSFKLSLEDKQDRLFGMKAINLKSMWNDVSQMREALAWDLFAEAGVVAPRHTYAKLCVEGQAGGQAVTRYMGLYSVIEQVDKAMLRDHFGKENDGGNLYKAYWPERDLGPATLGYRSSNGDDSGKQYRREADVDARTYQLKENDDDPALSTYDDLATLIRVVHGKTLAGGAGDLASPAYVTAVEEVFNAKQFLRWAAMSSLLGAWDNYWATPANYYLYDSGKKGGGADFMARPYFTWVPWDYDNTFGIDFHGTSWAEASIVDWSAYDGRTSNMENLALLRNLLQNPTFLAYYLDAIEHFDETLFTPAAILRRVERLRPRIERAAYLEGSFGDPAHTGRQFTNDEVSRSGFQHQELRRGSTFILGIEHFVRIRHDDVARQLQSIRRSRVIPKGTSGATFPARAEPLAP